jgi:serine/threonine protein phosphatase PrpC
MTIETTAEAAPRAPLAGQEADPAMPVQLTCPNCGADDLMMGEGERFCENCGYALAEPVTGEEDPPAQSGPKPCVSCGCVEIDDEGYCIDCGDLQPRRRDRMEVDLKAVAGISDKGLRHHRNEDSMALRPVVGPDGRSLIVAVVCDGVSTSERPDEASAAAVAAAARLLLTAIAAGAAEPELAPRTEPVETVVMATVSPDAAGAVGAAQAAQAAIPRPVRPAGTGRPARAADPFEISRQAVAAADRAVSDLARDSDHGNPPACTYVSAVVGADVTVAWLGDSRAYWLDERGTSRALTKDDAEEGSHAIEAWLGADSGAPEPHLAHFTPGGPGVVLVCSDGLWNYVEQAGALAELALPEALTDPFGAAARLVRRALDSGGHDNITAVLVPYPVQAPAEPSASQE